MPYIALGKRTSGLANPYKDLRHGDRVPNAFVEEGFRNAFVAIGTCILLSPSRTDLEQLRRLLHSDDCAPAAAAPAQQPSPSVPEVAPNLASPPAPAVLPPPAPAASDVPTLPVAASERRPGLGLPATGDLRRALKRPYEEDGAFSAASVAERRPVHQPFGHPHCHSGTDEQAICTLDLNARVPWTWIDPRHNYIPWQPHWIVFTNLPPTVFHYISTKPWLQARGAWPDLEAWWLVVDALVRRYPALAHRYDAASLAASPASRPSQPPTCPWCAGPGQEVAALRRKHGRNAPPAGTAGTGGAMPDATHAMFDDDGTLTCPALRPHRSMHA